MAEVRLEVDLAHPPDRVWRALTTARLLGAWFMPTDLEPREGSRFTLDPGTLAGFLGLVSGELLEVVADHRLVMLWQGEKLHTRVVWELAETAVGCRVRVVQTGFIGAPAALRRRALRDTYVRLFSEQLPVLLDRIATGTGDLGGALPGQRSGPEPPPALLRSVVPPGGGRRRLPGEPSSPGRARAGVPRQRRAGGNMAVTAWSAGRTIGSASSAAAAGGAAGLARAAGGGAAGAVDQVPAGPEPGSGSAYGSGRGSGSEEAPPRAGWWQFVPAWVRAVAIGAVAAVLALAVLTAVSQSAPRRDAGLGGQPGGPDAPPGGPGVALQPGASTSRAGPDGHPAPGPPQGRATRLPAGAEPSAVTELPGGGAGQGEPEPVRPGEGTRTPDSPAPVLTARLVTSGLPALGGLAVAVTVTNPGPGTATSWLVSMDVGDQAVTDVSGAVHQRDGSTALFTPVAAELPAGENVVFSFHLTAPVLGLLGGAQPTGCTVDGQPCQ